MLGAGGVKRLICIGTPEHAQAVEGALDMRGAPLAEQMNALRSARCAIGPSSGPMHLASLCKCPHLVWCGGGKGERSTTARRYARDWNPHGTVARTFECGSWQPPFDTVLAYVKKFLKVVPAC